MAMNFIGCDREQAFLMPPSLRDWVPEDHLVWTVLDAVAEVDLSAFYVSYRSDGHGRPAYEPSMMVALLLYAYARGNRSSRQIERACVEDLAYRVVAGNLVPDHSTIADFRVRHEAALAELFTAVLGLCSKAGLASVGVVAIDGTKVHANASRDANSGYEAIAREILAEAAETDQREDELYGDARGDELPKQLRTSAGRKAALRAAKERLDEERRTDGEPGTAEAKTPEREDAAVAIELDPRALSPAPRAAAPGFARAAARSISSVSARRGRSRALARSASLSQRAGSSRSYRQSTRQTPPMRPTARAG